MIDIHAHLDFLRNPDEAIERAEKAGVKIIINQSLNLEGMKKTLELAKKHETVKAALGIYPSDAEKMGEEEIEEAIKFMEKQEFTAIGEVGLDKKQPKNFEKQKAVFKKMLGLAEKLDKPVIIHSRNAEKEVLEILEDFKGKAILHSFTGKKNLWKKAIKKKYYFSIPTAIVRSRQFQELARETPVKQLFTETDTPFMSPHKGKDNEPAFVKEGVKKIAEIKGLDEQELNNLIHMNYQNVFL